ncbi:MAG: macro domain-containing protein [Flavobacteriales bacterium]
MKRNFGDSELETVQGDITRQTDIEAIVNAANARLETGGGVAGAIHRAAGAGLAEECRPMAPIEPGQAVVSTGHELPNPYVIHCLGPVYGKDEPAEQLLEDCYRNALELARDKGIVSVAFPAISTGAFGYPLEEAARTALRTVKQELETHSGPRSVRFVLFGSKDLQVHDEILEELG